MQDDPLFYMHQLNFSQQYNLFLSVKTVFMLEVISAIDEVPSSLQTSFQMHCILIMHNFQR